MGCGCCLCGDCNVDSKFHKEKQKIRTVCILIHKKKICESDMEKHLAGGLIGVRKIIHIS